MSVSQATVTPTNIQLTPQRVTYKGVDLGGTVDGVSISIKYDTADIMVDQFGKSIIDKVVSGMAYSIKFTISETKNTSNWAIVYPSMHRIVNGGTTSMYSDMQVGDHLLAKSGQLLLHPLENTDGNLNQDYLFYKAVSIEASEIKYGPDKQSGLAVEMIVFPDTSVSPARYMTYGDPSNGMTPAAAANEVPGSNTGNGNITAQAAYNGITKTETITILCVGSTSGNDFFVSGNLSGALGYCHVAAANLSTVNFVPQTGSPQVITFTLNQGSVQFITGDSFTIATTASNFS